MLFLLLLTPLSWIAHAQNRISTCFTSFSGAGGLVAQDPVRISASADTFRQIKTNMDVVTISRLDGYRILYNNSKGKPFLDLKVELSAPDRYGTDTIELIENLKYLKVMLPGMQYVTLPVNGYTIYGLTHSSVEDGTMLGTFAMFPGHNTVIYFNLINLKEPYRTYLSIEDYISVRDNFLDAYTRYLLRCIRP